MTAFLERCLAEGLSRRESLVCASRGQDLRKAHEPGHDVVGDRRCRHSSRRIRLHTLQLRIISHSVMRADLGARLRVRL